MTRDHVDVLRVGMLRSAKKSIAELPLVEQVVFNMAKNYNIEMFVFGWKDVNAGNQTINGLFLEGDKEFRRITAFPHIVDNLKTWKSKMFIEKYPEELKSISEHCLLLRAPIFQSKAKVYDMLAENGEFRHLLIPTHNIREFADIIKYLEEYNRVIIKPLVGSLGVMIHELWKDEDVYYIKLDQKVSKYTLETLEAYYIGNIAAGRIFNTYGEYVIQPFIHSKTKHGNPFDIRIHARRGGDGNFQVHYYPRIGDEKGIVSNISAGGYTMEINSFLKREFGEHSDYAAEELVKIGETFPDYYQTFFEDEIQAIGLDVGIDNTDGKITFHLFEVNSGYPFADFFEIKVARLNLGYYWHLFGKHGRG
jgi:glutathione synthase/RimK-type ligase-like ATP-grasp enzyme